MKQVYLDNNATTRLLPEVQEAIAEVMAAEASNASSAHSGGNAARSCLVRSRDAIGRLIGVPSDAVFFTSGGTEANNLVLWSAVRSAGRRPVRVAASPVEHVSVVRVCEMLAAQGIEVSWLPVGADGRVRLDGLREAISRDTTLVSVQWVNNETGVIQPVDEIGAICRSSGVLFHTDAAQAVGKVPIALADMPIDFLTLTAHKWHGPAGVGAVCTTAGRKLQPLIRGGDQERGGRAGTENLLGIAGMGRAAELRLTRRATVCRHMQEMRDLFENLLRSRIPNIRVNGDGAARVCNTSNILFDGVDGQALVAQLDVRGICCSQGSACEASRPEPSHVLRAMGLSERQAYSSVRFSFSELNTVDEARHAADAIVEIRGKLVGRASSRGLAAGMAREN